jgi:hypothetical protein
MALLLYFDDSDDMVFPIQYASIMHALDNHTSTARQTVCQQTYILKTAWHHPYQSLPFVIALAAQAKRTSPM